MQVEYIFVMKYGRGMPVIVKYVKKIFFSIFHYNEFQIFENGQKLTLQILEILCFKYSCCY